MKLNDISLIWNRENVVKAILECRRDEGIPVFKTKYAGKRFEIGGKPAVLMVCWGGHDNVGAYFFKDVPPREVEELEENVGDWRNLLEKYGTPEEIREAESYGVYIKGFRLPKIVKV